MEVDDYVIETLMPDLVGHDRHPAAFLVYLYLWGQTEGRGKSRVGRSLREIAAGAGLSKRAVQAALDRLVKRQLMGIRRESITAIAEYRIRKPWDRVASDP